MAMMAQKYWQQLLKMTILNVIGAMNRTVLGTSFHPELVDEDYRFHKWFLDKFVLKILDL